MVVYSVKTIRVHNLLLLTVNKNLKQAGRTAVVTLDIYIVIAYVIAISMVVTANNPQKFEELSCNKYSFHDVSVKFCLT